MIARHGNGRMNYLGTCVKRPESRPSIWDLAGDLNDSVLDGIAAIGRLRFCQIPIMHSVEEVIERLFHLVQLDAYGAGISRIQIRVPKFQMENYARAWPLGSRQTKTAVPMLLPCRSRAADVSRLESKCCRHLQTSTGAVDRTGARRPCWPVPDNGRGTIALATS